MGPLAPVFVYDHATSIYFLSIILPHCCARSGLNQALKQGQRFAMGKDYVV